jgi:hypothetical protein
MIKDENHVTVQGWMTKLGIKGNALIAYACIYGFSQDGESEFHGSAQYIADWCGISKNAAFDVLSSLVDKGLIAKRDVLKNGVKLCNYQAIRGGTQETWVGYPRNLGGGTQETCYHNISSNNKDKTTTTIFRKPTVEEVSEYCKERNTNIDPEKFVDYYITNGWMVGKNKMKDWKAAVRTWERNQETFSQNSFSPKKSSSAPGGLRINDRKTQLEMEEA